MKKKITVHKNCHMRNTFLANVDKLNYLERVTRVDDQQQSSLEYVLRFLHLHLILITCFLF